MLSVRRRQEDAGGAAGMGDDAELEEGEAWGDDTAFVDPDVALSYIDEKLQDVLGHFQKDFEGGVSAENLGSKFGGYGSFLPTYQRSPPLPQTSSPPKAANLSSRSPYHQSTKGVSQNSPSVAVPSVSQNPSSSNAEPPTSPSPTVRAPEPPPPPSPSPTIRAPEPLTP